VTSREEGDRQIITLTSEGGAQLEERSARLGDSSADFADAPTRRDPQTRLSRGHGLCPRSTSGATPHSSRPREPQRGGAAVTAFLAEAKDVAVSKDDYRRRSGRRGISPLAATPSTPYQLSSGWSVVLS
jgi:hypothetical protein